MHPNKAKRAAMRHPAPTELPDHDAAPAPQPDPEPVNTIEGPAPSNTPKTTVGPDGTKDTGEAAAQAADDAAEGKETA